MQFISILLQKHCVVLSDHITVGICSDTLLTQGATGSLGPITAFITQGGPSAL